MKTLFLKLKNHWKSVDNMSDKNKITGDDLNDLNSALNDVCLAKNIGNEDDEFDFITSILIYHLAFIYRLNSIPFENFIETSKKSFDIADEKIADGKVLFDDDCASTNH